MSDALRGNALIGQSGGPTMTVNATLAGAAEEAFKHPEIEHLYGSINGVEGILHENLVDLGQEDPAIWEQIKSTPSTALGSVRLKVKDNHLDRILEVFKAHDIRYFFYIGGNDSALTSHQLEQLCGEAGHEIQVMGIPKTVDNDLMELDHCPGYGSAARFIITATKCIDKDNEALRPVQFIEAMGRDTGWLAAASRLARMHEEDAPHLILVPEKPFEEERFIEEVKEADSRFGRVLAVASEGLRRPDGSQIAASTKVDSFGHVQLGGMAQYLTNLVERHLDVKARWDKLGTMQRSFMYCASETDLNESYEVGRLAVSHAVQGVSGKMVTLLRQSGSGYKCEFGLTDLMNVAMETRFLPQEYLEPDRSDIKESFIRYLQPLARGRAVTLDAEVIRFPRLQWVAVAKKLSAYAEEEAVQGRAT